MVTPIVGLHNSPLTITVVFPIIEDIMVYRCPLPIPLVNIFAADLELQRQQPLNHADIRKLTK